MDTGIHFDFEDYIVQELGILLVKPVQQELCKFFQQGQCRKGTECPFKHEAKARSVVCKHWLRGLCKKGDRCEFLHEYNMKKMPECWFYVKQGECTNPECQYLHIDPNSKLKDCAWYARGFCKHGPGCRHKHVRKAVCPNFVSGFCPLGEHCAYGHPKYELPVTGTEANNNTNNDEPHFRPNFYQQQFYQPQQQQFNPFYGGNRGFNPMQEFRPPPRNLAEVTCFKCGEMGHYANHCPKRRRMEDFQ